MNQRLSSLVTRDARTQTKIAIVLLAVIPALSLFYLGTTVEKDISQITALTLILIFVLTTAIAIPGFIILQKYPNNILRLRKYITEIAEGTLPDKIELVDTRNSDDIRYIEDSFNCVLKEMRHRIRAAEKQLQIEKSLNATIEKQQQILIEAERHRAMIQTLGATCHHIGQPATVLQLRLKLLQKLATDQEEIQEIDACIQAVQSIADILHQLQRVSEFRTVPYVQTENAPDEAILAIG
jgi:phosphoglycerate-specific signal transduction histidine kinase